MFVLPLFCFNNERLKADRDRVSIWRDLLARFVIDGDGIGWQGQGVADGHLVGPVELVGGASLRIFKLIAFDMFGRAWPNISGT